MATDRTYCIDNHYIWSRDRANQLALNLKKKIKGILYSCDSGSNGISDLEQMKAMCSLINDMTGCLHKRLHDENEHEAEFYEIILQSAFDLDIHELMFENLRVCFVVAQDQGCIGLFPDNQTSYKFDLSNKNYCKEMIEACIEVLSLLAAGNLLQGKSVRNIGLTPYIEKLALCGFNTTVSCYAFKMLTAFMYDDEKYGKDVCQRSKYSDRANDLFRDDNICISCKGYLVEFCTCSMYFHYFIPQTSVLKWPVRIWIYFGCHLIQCNDVLYQRKAVKLIHSIYNNIN